jgi:SAM-dependent methyltransferase
VNDYFSYQKALAVECLLPVLEREGVELAGRSVLEVGCGYGGVLAGLSERRRLGEAVGIDVDPEMIEAGRRRCPAGVRLEVGDFLRREPARSFDVVLLRDVLEHIVDVEGALRRARALLRPQGALYVSFAPFYSPFGGHQHIGGGPFSYVPWLQLLPAGIFRRLLRVDGSAYKSAPAAMADLDSVLRTRLTTGLFRRLTARLDLRVAWSRQYLVRPDHRRKLGLPPLALPRLPLLDELLCTGVEAILRPVR